jgi:hypothetical protein
VQPTVLQPKLQALFSKAVKACLSHDWPICSNRSLLLVPPLIRYRFCGITGWSVLGSWNQCNGWSPLLQEVVATPNPTKLPLLPPCETAGRSPTITSGPGTSAGASLPAAFGNGGITADLSSPFTNSRISIGCMTAPIEILPITDPAWER